MAQSSIIDSIKKHILLRKRFRAKKSRPFTFKTITSIASLIFRKQITKEMLLKTFNYQYLNRSGTPETVSYKVDVFSPKDSIIEISRKGFDGLYKTTLELSKNKKALYYFESVNLNQPPFQMWRQVGLLAFRYHFRKRKKQIKKELYNYE